MKQCTLLLPVLGLAPAGAFLGPYLEGAALLPGGTAVGIGSLLILPWVVAILFYRTLLAPKWVRASCFIAALCVQVTLIATLVPPGATCELMGRAWRLRQEFVPDQLHEYAARLREKHRSGALHVRKFGGPHHFLISSNAVWIEKSELPPSLSGRFSGVLLDPSGTPGRELVFFCFNERSGILCDDRRQVREPFVCSMADGLHAYRLQRQ